MNSKVKSINCASLLVIFCNDVHAEIAVIVNLANTDAIKKESIASLYLAKTRTFPGGTNAIPLDRPEGSPIRVEFVSKVIEKDESQMKSYWSRLIFTGKGVPPKVLESDAEVKEMVARNPDAIGFIDAGAVDSTVKVVATF
jgi:ABC-type phosphate transport system substrate-binding protein